MLALEDFMTTLYKAATRIKKMSTKRDFMYFVSFAYEIALKLQPPNDTSSSNHAREHQNIQDFVGFIYSRDVQGKSSFSCKV